MCVSIAHGQLNARIPHFGNQCMHRIPVLNSTHSVSQKYAIINPIVGIFNDVCFRYIECYNLHPCATVVIIIPYTLPQLDSMCVITHGARMFWHLKSHVRSLLITAPESRKWKVTSASARSIREGAEQMLFGACANTNTV